MSCMTLRAGATSWNAERNERMRIDGAELRLIELPLVAPFTTSFGTQTVRSALILTLHGDGISGYGECVAMEGPWYSYETVGTAELVIREYLLPILLGREIADADEVWDRFA